MLNIATSFSAATYITAKTLGLGFIAFAVINNNGISPTFRAVIVAVISGALGILGIYIGQKMSAKSNRDILEKATENQKLAEENKQLLKELHSMADRREKPRKRN